MIKARSKILSLQPQKNWKEIQQYEQSWKGESRYQNFGFNSSGQLPVQMNWVILEPHPYFYIYEYVWFNPNSNLLELENKH